MMAVPERLEDGVGEPNRPEVLHHLLPQIMVDPVDLLLLQQLRQLAVQLVRRRLRSRRQPAVSSRYGAVTGRLRLLAAGGEGAASGGEREGARTRSWPNGFSTMTRVQPVVAMPELLIERAAGAKTEGGMAR